MIKNTINLIINPLFVIYKLFSVILPCSCRYYPSCSDYSRKSIERYGVFKGLILSLKRLLKCNPIFPGGYDPIK